LDQPAACRDAAPHRITPGVAALSVRPPERADAKALLCRSAGATTGRWRTEPPSPDSEPRGVCCPGGRDAPHLTTSAFAIGVAMSTTRESPGRSPSSARCETGRSGSLQARAAMDAGLHRSRAAAPRLEPQLGQQRRRDCSLHGWSSPSRRPADRRNSSGASATRSARSYAISRLSDPWYAYRLAY
jgi:hypothetical protein